MRALAAFAAAAAVVVASIAALNWWLDPLGQFWDEDVLAAAERGDCVISDDLVGTSSWLPFKEDVYERRRPRTVVVGTSRVLMLDRDTRSFANLGMPGTGPDTLAPLFRRLHAIDGGPLTVLLGADLFWFNGVWLSNVVFDQGLPRDLKYVVARQTLSASLRLVRESPTALLHAFRIERTPEDYRCVVDRGARAALGDKDAWEPNGSFVYRHELGGARIEEDEFERDLVRFDGPYYRDWDAIPTQRIAQLHTALELARSYGWKVVGFTSPYASRYRERLQSAPQTREPVRALQDLLPRWFGAYGFRYVDWRDFDCRDDEYVDDGWHPDERCAAKVLAALEAADVPG